MPEDSKVNIEGLLFSYIDEFKFLLYPEQWGGIFLDYSKNEILTLLLLYRFGSRNMTEIAGYINAPLNTATGVVSRLEKKEMVERIRSSDDRRIVQITLTEKARGFITEEKGIITYYIKKIYSALSEDEKRTALGIFSKVIQTLKAGRNTEREGDPAKKVKKIVIE